MSCDEHTHKYYQSPLPSPTLQLLQAWMNKGLSNLRHGTCATVCPPYAPFQVRAPPSSPPPGGPRADPNASST